MTQMLLPHNGQIVNANLSIITSGSPCHGILWKEKLWSTLKSLTQFYYNFTKKYFQSLKFTFDSPTVLPILERNPLYMSSTADPRVCWNFVSLDLPHHHWDSEIVLISISWKTFKMTYQHEVSDMKNKQPNRNHMWIS